MLGIPKTLTPTAVVTLAVTVVAVVIAAQIAASLVTRRPPAPLDWFALVSAALIVAMFLWPPYYAAHYAAFFGPFLALSLALPVARLAEGLASRRAARGGPVARPATPWLARAGLIVLGLAVLAGAAAQAGPPTHWTTRFGVPTVTLRLIPRGACVITDSAVYLLIANRFTSDVPGCSQMVDSLGTDLALGDGRRPGSGAGQVPAVSEAWHQAFSTAGWVLLTPKSSLRIPWNPALARLFPQPLPAGAAHEYLQPLRPGRDQVKGTQPHTTGWAGQGIVPMPHPAGVLSLPLHGENEKPAR